MRINIKIFALFVLVALQGRVFCEPDPLEAVSGLLGGLGGSKGAGAAGDSIGGLGKGGVKGLPLFGNVFGMVFDKNVALQAVKKFKFLYTFLNMTKKLTNMVGLGKYGCDFKSCTGLAYCFGVTREFQVNMSLCAEEDKTTVSPEEVPPEDQQNGAGGAGDAGGAGGAGGAPAL